MGMLVEISVLEAYQVQAALERRMAVLTRGERLVTPNSLEAAMVQQGIQYTGSILTSLVALLYGEDEPDGEEFNIEGRDLTDDPDWMNREGMPEFNGAFR